MPKLPKYVFKRPNGSYRYKRNVPKKLWPVIRKRTIYRQLGKTYEEAIRMLPLVHAEIEALFGRERDTPPGTRAKAIIGERLGEWHAKAFAAGVVDVEWPVYDDYVELAELVEHRVPKEVTRQIANASMTPEPMSLKRCLEEYYAYKCPEGNEDRGLRTRIDRISNDLSKCLGKDQFEKTELKQIKRTDANNYRDFLLKIMSANSVVRTVGVVKAAINHAIIENDLDIKNVFQGLRVQGAGASKTDRLPMSDHDLATIEANCKGNDIASMYLAILADTGTRVGEIAGLQVRDLDLDKKELHIRPNDFRGLKTKSSVRTIPLSPRIHSLLEKHTSDLEQSSPVFEKYARDRGSDAASAMLMKHVRKVTTDKKITLHSLRHRMKDKLRNSGCPEHLSMAILGHSANSIAANYGSGYAMDVMREAMEKVWE